MCESPEALQEALNILETFCCTWSLEVNHEKTKVIVFGEQPSRDQIFTYAGHALELVTEFSLLGLLHSSTNKWNCAVDKLINQSRKALYHCTRSSADLHLTPLTSTGFGDC